MLSSEEPGAQDLAFDRKIYMHYVGVLLNTEMTHRLARPKVWIQDSSRRILEGLQGSVKAWGGFLEGVGGFAEGSGRFWDRFWMVQDGFGRVQEDFRGFRGSPGFSVNWNK